jgi:hypothetical protein
MSLLSLYNREKTTLVFQVKRVPQGCWLPTTIHFSHASNSHFITSFRCPEIGEIGLAGNLTSADPAALLRPNENDNIVYLRQAIFYKLCGASAAHFLTASGGLYIFNASDELTTDMELSATMLSRDRLVCTR